jgi:predicted histidine transporter YuiF (NhaC family)
MYVAWCPSQGWEEVLWTSGTVEVLVDMALAVMRRQRLWDSYIMDIVGVANDAEVAERRRIMRKLQLKYRI